MSEVNLSLRSDVRLTTSVVHPSGLSTCDPRLLLNETAHQLHGRPLPDFASTPSYNTYDGQKLGHDLDWYAIEFAEPTTFNCLEMTMGLPTGAGGWWTSLAIEARSALGEWYGVETLRVFPPYNFADQRGDRRPFETHILTFNTVTTQAVRVIGRPGGPAQFTSLARLALYHRDLSRWNPADVPQPASPRIFQLISPEQIWELCDHLTKVAGVMVSLPFVEYYLDQDRYDQFWRRVAHNHHGEPELWFLAANRLGWEMGRYRVGAPLAHAPMATGSQVQTILHNTLAQIVTPVVVEDEGLGQLITEPAVLKDELDWGQQPHPLDTSDLAWPTYQAALNASPRLTIEQLAGVAAMMNLIATTIAQQVRRTLYTRHGLNGHGRNGDQRSQARQDMVRQAIDLMEKNLEAPIGVADVARSLNLSLPYFSTLFTELTGRNPRDFLIDMRIERAKDYLLHTSMSVHEVCIILGYSRSYFSRLFKQRVGHAPEDFARHMRHNGATGLRSPHF